MSDTQLQLTLGANVSGFTEGVAKAAKALDELRKQLKKILDEFGNRDRLTTFKAGIDDIVKTATDATRKLAELKKQVATAASSTVSAAAGTASPASGKTRAKYTEEERLQRERDREKKAEANRAARRAEREAAAAKKKADAQYEKDFQALVADEKKKLEATVVTVEKLKKISADQEKAEAELERLRTRDRVRRNTPGAQSRPAILGGSTSPALGMRGDADWWRKQLAEQERAAREAAKVVDNGVVKNWNKNHAVLRLPVDPLKKSITEINQVVDGFADGIKQKLLNLRTLFLSLGALKLGKDVIAGAGDFELAIARLGIVADATDKDLANMRERVLAIANDSSVPLQTLGEALGEIVGTLPKSAHAMELGLDILNTSQKAARASGASVADVSRGLVGVLNTYKEKAGSAEAISDKLFATWDQGGARIADLAAHLGDVVGIAANLNVPLEELLGSIAVLTRSGQSASTAITNVRQALVTMSRPPQIVTDRLADLAKETKSAKIEFSETGVRMNGFIGTLQKLEKIGAGGVLGKLFTDIQGNVAANTLVKVGLDTVVDDIERIRNAGGKTNDSLNRVKQTLPEVIGVLKNKFSVVLNQIGTDLLPAVKDGLERLTNFLITNKDSIASGIKSLLQALIDLTGWVATNGKVLLTTFVAYFAVSRIEAATLALIKFGSALKNAMAMGAAGNVGGIMGKLIDGGVFSSKFGAVLQTVLRSPTIIGILAGAGILFADTIADTFSEAWINHVQYSDLGGSLANAMARSLANTKVLDEAMTDRLESLRVTTQRELEKVQKEFRAAGRLVTAGVPSDVSKFVVGANNTESIADVVNKAPMSPDGKVDTSVIDLRIQETWRVLDEEAKKARKSLASMEMDLNELQKKAARVTGEGLRALKVPFEENRALIDRLKNEIEKITSESLTDPTAAKERIRLEKELTEAIAERGRIQVMIDLTAGAMVRNDIDKIDTRRAQVQADITRRREELAKLEAAVGQVAANAAAEVAKREKEAADARRAAALEKAIANEEERKRLVRDFELRTAKLLAEAAIAERELALKILERELTTLRDLANAEQTLYRERLARANELATADVERKKALALGDVDAELSANEPFDDPTKRGEREAVATLWRSHIEAAAAEEIRKIHAQTAAEVERIDLESSQKQLANLEKQKEAIRDLGRIRLTELWRVTTAEINEARKQAQQRKVAILPLYMATIKKMGVDAMGIADEVLAHVQTKAREIANAFASMLTSMVSSGITPILDDMKKASETFDKAMPEHESRDSRMQPKGATTPVVVVNPNPSKGDPYYSQQDFITSRADAAGAVASSMPGPFSLFGPAARRGARFWKSLPMPSAGGEGVTPPGPLEAPPDPTRPEAGLFLENLLAGKDADKALENAVAGIGVNVDKLEGWSKGFVQLLRGDFVNALRTGIESTIDLAVDVMGGFFATMADEAANAIVTSIQTYLVEPMRRMFSGPLEAAMGGLGVGVDRLFDVRRRKPGEDPSSFPDPAGNALLAVVEGANNAKMMVNLLRRIGPELVSRFVDTMGKVLPDLIPKVVGVFVEVVGVLERKFADMAARIFDVLGDVAPALIDGAARLVPVVVEAVARGAVELTKDLPKIVAALAKSIGTVLGKSMSAIGQQLGPLGAALGEAIGPMITEVLNALPGILADTLVGMIDVAFLGAAEFITNFLAGFVADFPKIVWQIVVMVPIRIVQGLGLMFERLWNNLPGYIKDGVVGLLEGIGPAIKETLEIVLDPIVVILKAIEAALSAAGEFGGEIGSAVKGVVGLGARTLIDGATLGVIPKTNSSWDPRNWHQGGTARGSNPGMAAAMAASGALAFAGGGMVPMPGRAAMPDLRRLLNGDETPAILRAGEGVVNPGGMRVLGEDGLAALNRGQAPSVGGGANVSVTLSLRGGNGLTNAILGRVSADVENPAGRVRRSIDRKVNRGPLSTRGVRGR